MAAPRRAPTEPTAEERRRLALARLLELIDTTVPYQARRALVDAVLDYGAAATASALDVAWKVHR